jgi:glyceraldehyde-3-phosphate dehydrogenase (NADP+)
MSAGERSAKLEALAAVITKREEELAMLIVREGGKPIGYAKAEIARCITTVRTAAAEALRFTANKLTSPRRRVSAVQILRGSSPAIST